MRLTEKLVAFDLETTSANPHLANIVQATLVDDERVLDYEVDPGVPIPEETSKVHGVWEKDRRSRTPQSSIVPELVEKIYDYWEGGYSLVVFNASYDLTILHRLAPQYGGEFSIRGPVLDPFVIDKTLDKYRKGSRTLTNVAAHYGQKLSGAHNAVADSSILIPIVREQAKKYPDFFQNPETINRRQALAYKDNQTSLEAFFKEKGTLNAPINKNWPIAVNGE